MIITEHIPSSCAYTEPKTFIVNNESEFFDCELIKRYKKVPNYHRLVYSDNLIMIELNRGYNWWVIGSVQNEEDKKLLKQWLPKFTPKEYE